MARRPSPRAGSCGCRRCSPRPRPASTLPAADAWRALAQQLDAPAGLPGPAPQPAPRPPVAIRPRRAVGQRRRHLDERSLRALRQAHPRAQAARGARRRPRRARARHHRAPRARALRQAASAASCRRTPSSSCCASAARSFPRIAHRPRVMAVWWPRFLQVVRWVVAQEAARRPALRRGHRRGRGRARDRGTGRAFSLVARADRLERQPDGRITVIDYKTGQLPSEPGRAGRQAAAAAARGGDGRGRRVRGARWRRPRSRSCCSGGSRATRRAASRSVAVAKQAPAELAAAARAGLELWSPTTTGRRPPIRRSRGRASAPRRDYDHLARRGEWLA